MGTRAYVRTSVLLHTLHGVENSIINARFCILLDIKVK
jgi:hypothetical protein